MVPEGKMAYSCRSWRQLNSHIN